MLFSLWLLPLGFPATPTLKPLETCSTVYNVSLNGTLLNKYSGVGSTDACCQLCSTFTNGSCTAYTVKKGTCFIFKDLSHMAAEEGALTGYTSAAQTHYQDPARVGCGATDEIANAVPAVEGSFCSAPCTKDNTWCPPDKPNGVTATPKCLIKDPVGNGMHCALSCKDDSECGTNGKCSVTYGPGNGFCVYPPTSPVGMIQLVYGTTCPTGWKEKSELRGQVIAGAPEPAAGGTTNKQPALGANETGRVGPHGHTATAKITDPGHTHTNTLTDPGHKHDVTDPGHTHAATVTDPGHAHNLTDPGHRHTMAVQFWKWGGTAGYSLSGPGVGPTSPDTTKAPTGVTVNSGPTGITVANAAGPTGAMINASLSGVTISNVAAPTGVSADVAVTAKAGSFYPLAYVIACVRV